MRLDVNIWKFVGPIYHIDMYIYINIYIYMFKYDCTPTCPIQLVFMTTLAPEMWRFDTLLVGLVEICWLLILVIFSLDPFLVIVETIRSY